MRRHAPTQKDSSAEQSPSVAFDEASVVGKAKVKIKAVTSPFLTTEEAADYLRIGVRALENFRLNGGGPKYRKHGAIVVYHIDDLIAWSKMREYEHTGGAGE